MGMETGARPGGCMEVDGLRTGPPSMLGEERIEVRSLSGAFPLAVADGEVKEGMAVWLMEGWL